MKRFLRLIISLGVHLWDILADGASRLLRIRKPGRCTVIYYHSVPRQHRSLFARQLDTISASCKALPASHGEPLALNTNHVVVTFDDAFISVVENARPELTRRSIPWTVFVPTGCLGKPPSWIENARAESKADRVVTPEELRELARDPLVTIASHSISHPNFLRLDETSAARELRESRSTLEALLSRPIEFFSFPYGAHNARIHQQARDAGYRRIFTSEPLPAFASGPEFVTGRIGVDPDDWPLEFRLKISGAYRWAGRLQAARRNRRTLSAK